MSLTKGLRWLTVMIAIAIASTVAIQTVRAQEEGDAAKVKKSSVHAKGPITIAATPCASPTAGIECYSVTSDLTEGKTSGTLKGTLLVSTTTASRGKHTVCFTINAASTETLTVGTAVADLDFGAGTACITEKTTKAASTFSEVVTPAAPWKSATGSPEVGSGKETWKVTATDNTSLAGTGTVSFTGSEEP